MAANPCQKNSESHHHSSHSGAATITAEGGPDSGLHRLLSFACSTTYVSYSGGEASWGLKYATMHRPSDSNAAEQGISTRDDFVGVHASL